MFSLVILENSETVSMHFSPKTWYSKWIYWTA